MLLFFTVYFKEQIFKVVLRMHRRRVNVLMKRNITAESIACKKPISGNVSNKSIKTVTNNSKLVQLKLPLVEFYHTVTQTIIANE
jgi:hypothetical protein